MNFPVPRIWNDTPDLESRWQLGQPGSRDSGIIPYHQLFFGGQAFETFQYEASQYMPFILLPPMNRFGVSLLRMSTLKYQGDLAGAERCRASTPTHSPQKTASKPPAKYSIKMLAH